MRQSTELDDSQCNTPCEGFSEICGGSSALSVYAQKGAHLGLGRRSHRVYYVASRHQMRSMQEIRVI